MVKRRATKTAKKPRERRGAQGLRPSQQRAGREFQTLVNIMARLRSASGCPWDREQTIESLRGFVLEESYEVLDAIDRLDHDSLRGEIGDLLFEGVFLAQVETDDGRFTVADSLRAVNAKLIRRHPHIFGTRSAVKTPDQVREQWEQIKAREQKEAGEQRSILRGVPKSLPALLRAHEIGTRVGAVGFDWARTTDVVEKIQEEVEELRRALATEGSSRTEEEMGDLLFAMANLARKLNIEPESALRKANEKFSGRFEAVERALEARGRSVHDATLEEMEAEWVIAKNSTVALNQRQPPVVLHAPTAVLAKKRRSEEAKGNKAHRGNWRKRAGRAPAGGRRQK